MNPSIIENLSFIPITKAYPEKMHVIAKCRKGDGKESYTRALYYCNGGKPTFAAFGLELHNVVAWAYMPERKVSRNEPL